MKQSYSISDSLPWLLSTLIIIGIAMIEEIKMSKLFGGKYDEYRKNSYFMIPMPKYFCRVLSAPFKTFFNKPFPTNKREIILVLSFYFSITVLLTILLNIAAEMKVPGKWAFESGKNKSVTHLTKEFLENPYRKEKYYLAETLVAKGDSAIPIFIDLLSNSDPVVREFSADALGNLKSETAANALIRALKDNNYKVVLSVLNSLGKYKSDSVIESLINLLGEDNLQQTSMIAGALVRVGNEKSINAVIPYAEKGLIEPNINLILALRNSKTQNAEQLIQKYLMHKDENIRQVAVIASRNFASEKIKTALIKSLNDENWEVRIYAEEILREM